MSLPTVKMGFEGQILMGVAGATATSPLPNTKDMAYNCDKESGDTTVRGTSLAAPVKTGQTTLRVASVEWTMINDTTDAQFESLRAAAFSGDPIAIRTKDHATGKGIDADCAITAQNAMPLNGEQTTQFTAEPCRGFGRDPSLWV